MKFSLLALSCLPSITLALNIPVQQLTKRHPHGLVKRDSFGQKLDLNDTKDLIYMANVQIEGQSFVVQLDTGSSDLWVATSSGVLGTNTNIPYNISYGIGYAAGLIARGKVNFAGFNIDSQAYLAGTDVNNPATSYNAQGVLGLGFTSLSHIDSQVNSSGASWGRSLLYNVFAQNISEPNFIAFSLQRNENKGKTVQGAFTIGEYVPDYAGVANTAPISTFPAKNPTRWSVLVDSVIANGKAVPLNSAVNGVPKNKAVSLLDTGTSFVYAPEKVVSALYSNIPDATFSQSLGKWIVPCEQEVDVSIVIGGRQMDIHPLDVVQPTDEGSTTCFGTWLPQDLSVGQSEFDFIFGDAVLRSVYTVFDFGDFDSNKKMGDPYIKLWSLVTGSDASIEFHQIRGGVAHNTFTSNKGVNAAAADANTPSSGSSDTGTDVTDLKNKVESLMKWMPVALALVGLNMVVLVVVLIATIFSCCRRRQTGRTSGSFIPLPLAGSSAASQYRPVSLHSQDSSYPPPKPRGPGARYSD